jgi:formylglycine-generating enzyme required for sulfatase activity
MHGNVKEVVSDYYHTQYYKYSPLQDPTGPLESTSSHVVRGGAYYNSPQRSRSSYRYFLQDDEREESIGFRVAFTASEDEKSGLSSSEDELQKQNKIMESILKEKMDN